MILHEALQAVRGNYIINVGPDRDDIIHAVFAFNKPEQQARYDIKLDHILEDILGWTVVKMQSNKDYMCSWIEVTVTPSYPTDMWIHTFKDLYKDKTTVDLLLKSQNPSTRIFVDGVEYDFADFLTKYVCNHVYEDYLCTAFREARVIFLYSSVEAKVRALTKRDIDHVKNCRRIDGKWVDEKEDESDDN